MPAASWIAIVPNRIAMFQFALKTGPTMIAPNVRTTEATAFVTATKIAISRSGAGELYPRSLSWWLIFHPYRCRCLLVEAPTSMVGMSGVTHPGTGMDLSRTFADHNRTMRWNVALRQLSE